jgi:hypothetical protein
MLTSSSLIIVVGLSQLVQFYAQFPRIKHLIACPLFFSYHSSLKFIVCLCCVSDQVQELQLSLGCDVCVSLFLLSIPATVAQLIRFSACRLQGTRFDSQSGPFLRERERGLLTDSVDSPCTPLSPDSINIKKLNP